MVAGTNYALGALIAFGIGDFIYKQAMRAGIQPAHFLAGLAWIFNSIIFLYALSTKTLIPSPAALWGCLAGSVVFIGQHQFLKSLELGPVSIATPVFRLNFVVTAVLGIVILWEPLTLLKIGSFLLAIVATWLLVARTSDQTHCVRRTYFLHLTIAALTMGSGSFFQKLGLSQGVPPETMLVSQGIVFVSLATTYLKVTEGKIKLPMMAWSYSLPAAILSVTAFMLMLYGLSMGPVSVLAPIAQMGFIVTSALGIILIGEPITVRQIIGLPIAVIALLALAGG